MWFSPTRPGFESRLGNFSFLRSRRRIFGALDASVVVFRLDGRAVQGAGFRHQSLRRQGFESPSNHLNFFFAFNIPKSARVKCGVALESSRLAQLVERKTLNLVVVGSSPTVGVLSFCVSIFLAPREFITLVLPAGGALDTLPEWLRGSPAK